jgi:hypothetical protein
LGGEIVIPTTPRHLRVLHALLIAIVLAVGVGLGTLLVVYEHRILLGVVVISIGVTVSIQLLNLLTGQGGQGLHNR